MAIWLWSGLLYRQISTEAWMSWASARLSPQDPGPSSRTRWCRRTESPAEPGVRTGAQHDPDVTTHSRGGRHMGHEPPLSRAPPDPLGYGADRRRPSCKHVT
jgi:hypothetical protein